ncbi:MAG: hypothetical protein H6667_20940 [Ardenticatenaceae bacterium]|nr:hypothetical protein [Ardenticatenaceae bacterium]MCB9446594.1 hypothetical protein [Ardenticatenaceae bacterium]
MSEPESYVSEQKLSPSLAGLLVVSGSAGILPASAGETPALHQQNIRASRFVGQVEVLHTKTYYFVNGTTTMINNWVEPVLFVGGKI